MAAADPAGPAGCRLHINATRAVMGGAARHLPPFLDALAAVRPYWSVCVWVPEGHDPGPDGAPFERREVPRRALVAGLWWESTALGRELRRDGADALLNLTNTGPLVGGPPTVLYQRNPIWFDRRWTTRLPAARRLEARVRRRLTFRMVRTATITVVPSAAMDTFLRSWPGFPARARVRVVPHAVDATRFAPADRPWPPPPDRPVRLLCVAHAAPHKNQVLLIDAVRTLVDGGLAVELWLTVDRADDPACVDLLADRMRTLGVEDHVRLLGRVADPRPLYRDADVLVFPSVSESFGFPVVEAMAARLPVVASGIAASRELLGPDGWYHDPDDADDAVRTVRRLLATPAAEVGATLDRARHRAARLTWRANATRVAEAVEQARASAGHVVAPPPADPAGDGPQGQQERHDEHEPQDA